MFSSDYLVLEPQDSWRYDGNSPYCKYDMKNKTVPCVIAIKKDDNEFYDDDFSYYVGNKNAIKFYFGEQLDYGSRDYSILTK